MTPDEFAAALLGDDGHLTKVTTEREPVTWAPPTHHDVGQVAGNSTPTTFDIPNPADPTPVADTLEPHNQTQPAGDPRLRFTPEEAAELDQVATHRADLKAMIEKYQGQIEDDDAYLKTKLRPGEKWEVLPGVGVRIQPPGRKFDQATAMGVAAGMGLEPSDFVREQIDTAALKAALKRVHALDQAMAPGTGNATVVSL